MVKKLKNKNRRQFDPCCRSRGKMKVHTRERIGEKGRKWWKAAKAREKKKIKRSRRHGAERTEMSG